MWVLLIVALLAQAPGASQAPAANQATSAPAPDLIDQGNQALDQGRYEAAADLFSKAVAATPQDVSAHFNLALAYNLLGRDADAIPVYRKVLEIDPAIFEAYVNLGQTLIRSRDAAGAIPLLKRAAEMKPQEFKPNYYLGEAYFETGQFADAIPAYTAAVAADAGSAPAELGLGRSLVRAGKHADAEPHYRRAVTIDSEYRSFLLELAEQYDAADLAQPALALYREFPDDPGAQERIAMLSLKIGDRDGAIAALESVVSKSPSAANQLVLADTYVQKRDLAKAEPLLAAAVAAEPNDFDLRMFYGRVLRDQRKSAEAAREFRAATLLKPQESQAWRELAGELILDEQYPAALAALDKVRDLGAENLGVYFFRATTLDRLGERKEALEYYNKFLDASRENPDQEFQARQRVRVLELELGKR